jgi:hypothetical protein
VQIQAYRRQLLGHMGRIGVHDLPQQKLRSNGNDLCFQSLSLPAHEFGVVPRTPLSSIEAVFTCQAKELPAWLHFRESTVLAGTAQRYSTTLSAVQFS